MRVHKGFGDREPDARAARRRRAGRVPAPKTREDVTEIVGRDPEIVAPRPPDFLALALNLLNLKGGTLELAGVVRNACGRLGAEEATFIPEMERPKVFREARIWLAIYAAVIATALATGSFLPLMLVGLPSFYGAWFHLFTGLTQHVGLAEDVLDHRLNSRTVLMNPVLRFLYWNMNYHVEHHMYPGVPCYHLPRLRKLIEADLGPATLGLRGIVKAMRQDHAARQLGDCSMNAA